MVITASSSRQIAALVADLSGDSDVAREAAVARLTVMGARGVERLLDLARAEEAPPAARVAALRALEAIGDFRALEPVLDLIDTAPASVAAAAVAAVRPFLPGPKGVIALDRLATIALDASRDDAARVAALEAVGDLDPATVAPIWKALADDPSEAVRAVVAAGPADGRGPTDPAERLTRAAEGTLPEEAALVRQAIGRAGAKAPLPVLLAVIDRLREREAVEPTPARRADWTTARAAAHVALAKRGSRLAVYDLRESLEAADAPLPVEFLAAVSLVGDVSCLEAIAAAYARSANTWWRQHLRDAFRAIVARERVTGRHASIKKIRKRWPAIAADLTEARRAG